MHPKQCLEYSRHALCLCWVNSRWVNGWMDGQMVWWMGGWAERLMNGKRHRCVDGWEGGRRRKWCRKGRFREIWHQKDWVPSPGVLPFGRKNLKDFANLYPSWPCLKGIQVSVPWQRTPQGMLGRASQGDHSTLPFLDHCGKFGTSDTIWGTCSNTWVGSGGVTVRTCSLWEVRCTNCWMGERLSCPLPGVSHSGPQTHMSWDSPWLQFPFLISDMGALIFLPHTFFTD